MKTNTKWQTAGKKKKNKFKYLESFCDNLTRKAREGKLDTIIGREKEIERAVQILSRRSKNNPCLIGEPGVGKTAIVEGYITEDIESYDTYCAYILNISTIYCLYTHPQQAFSRGMRKLAPLHEVYVRIP